MTIQELIDALAGRATGLGGTLGKAGELLPDLKDETDAQQVTLASALAPENLLAMVKALPGEVANIIRLHIDAHHNPANFS